MNEAGRSVARKAGIVGAGTLSSRVLGVVRESVIAAYFEKEVIDAFQVAFMLPNSFRRLTAEGAFSISITTVFSKLRQEGDPEQSRQFVSAVYGFSIAFLALLTVLGVFGAHWLTLLAGWGFSSDPGKFVLATRLTATMFPYIFFISLTALAMGLLNASGRFFAPAFAPALLSVAIIGCAVGLSGTMPSLGLDPVFSLAAGVLIGGVAQLVAQLPSLRALGLLVRPAINLRDPALRRVLKITAPMVIGASAYQAYNILATSFASTLGHGAVTFITFAQRFFELPLAVLVMAISTAALPGLAGLVGAGKIDEAKNVWIHALRLALFVSTPAMVALIVLAEPVITIMYQRGLFSHGDAVETAGALRWLSAGMISVALLRQTTPFFYAFEKVRIPVVMTFVNIGAYAIAAVFLKDRWGHRGLCMATSIAATVQGVGLLLALRMSVGTLGLTGLARNWLRVIVATVPMGLVIYFLSGFAAWEQGGNDLHNIVILAGCVVAGVVIYALTAWILRVAELRELVEALKRRRRRRVP